MSQWLYKGSTVTEVTDNYIGFVYIITNLTNNKKYIGKKLIKFKKTKIVKGKRKRLLVDSDWQVYWGSNDLLKEDIKTLGETKFSREIIKFCSTKGELSYIELKEQILRGALESDEYYNSWIMVRVRKDHLKRVDFSQ